MTAASATCFWEVYDKEFAAEFKKRNLTYEDRLIDDMVALAYRFDNTPDVVRFAEILERVCVDTVQSGDVTRDLAILIRADHPWLTTNQFLDKLDSNLTKAMA